MELTGKVAVVLGAGSGGIGRVTALRLARGGAAVVASDIRAEGAEETARLIRGAGGTAAAFGADVAAEDQVCRLIEFAVTALGGVDILVNAASADYRPGAPMADWKHTLDVDIHGTLYCLQYATPAMQRRGGGAIVTIGSTSALGCKASAAPAYDTAKAAVMRMSTNLAGLAKTAGIRVNCIVPDWVATPQVRAYWDPLSPEQRVAAGAPPMLTPIEDIAAGIAWLVSNEALAGRMLVYWTGKPPGLIPYADPGYVGLEDAMVGE